MDFLGLQIRDASPTSEARGGCAAAAGMKKRSLLRAKVQGGVES